MLVAQQTPTLGCIIKFVVAIFFAWLVALALSCPATAAPQPSACPKNTVTIGNQGQVVDVPQSQVCDNDPTGGLLGDLPVLGNLPGLGGIL